MNVLITAGPTREFLDPVRFLSNRSTGKMGFAVAEAAVEAGHTVTLIAGPVALATPRGVARVDVVSARDMLAAIEASLPTADALVMAAAVADWRPACVADEKLKKATMDATLTLVPNPDILKTIQVRTQGKIVVGFAAETGDPVAEASRKCAAKGLDFIVANDVSQADAGFAVDTNRVIFVNAAGSVERLPLMSKMDVGRAIVRRIETVKEVKQ